MFALNFQSPYHEDLLITRTKNCTIRIGDLSDVYPENSIVWITFGKKFSPRKKLYQAVIDKVFIKQFSQLTAKDLVHQNPGIKSAEELKTFFEQLYSKSLTMEDYVSVIYFSEIIGD